MASCETCALPPPSPSPPSPPAAPPLPPLLPSQPTTIFDFSNDLGPGWAVGGNNPFIRFEGRTPSVLTGPSAGVGGSGHYMYVEMNRLQSLSDLSTLAYDGSACSAIGQGVSTVGFYYHMYGRDIGELRLINAAGEAGWSLAPMVTADSY